MANFTLNKINDTIISENSSVLSKPIDLEVECDIAYGNYLQSLMTEHILGKTIKKYELALDDQLSIQTQILHQGKNQLDQIDTRINEVTLEVELEQLYKKFKEVSFEINKILQNFKVEENLVVYKTNLENSCNKLYLKNVKPLKSQEEFDKFSAALHKFFKSLKHFNEEIVNTETINLLEKQLQKIQQSLNDLKIKLKTSSDLQTDFNLHIYKKLSDQLANYM